MRRYRGRTRADGRSVGRKLQAITPANRPGRAAHADVSVIWRHAVPTARCVAANPGGPPDRAPPAARVGEGSGGKATAGPYWLSICRPRWQATADLQSDHISRRRWADDEDVTPVRSSSNSINARPAGRYNIARMPTIMHPTSLFFYSQRRQSWQLYLSWRTLTKTTRSRLNHIRLNSYTRESPTQHRHQLSFNMQSHCSQSRRQCCQVE